MRTCLMLAVLIACKTEEKPKFQASCKPDALLEKLECVVENVGKKAGRACVTAREQPPKVNAIIAQRVCTKKLEPGEKLTFTPKFDRYETLTEVCSQDGKWICKDEIVETPAMLGENIGDGK